MRVTRVQAHPNSRSVLHVLYDEAELVEISPNGIALQRKARAGY